MLEDAKYVNLHCHSMYSAFDGIAKYQDYCDHIKANDMYPSFAMTEHGYLGSTLDYIDTCNKNGIKPIVGCEIYMCTEDQWRAYQEEKETFNRYHLVVLCKNLEGYKDLVGMNNDAIRKGQVLTSKIKRQYVLITPDLIEKWNHGNWIILNACLGSFAIHPATFENNIKETVNRVRWLRDQFGEDYYFEFQTLNMDEQRKMNMIQVKLMTEFFKDQKAVVTSDSHYIERSQNIARDVVMAINWKVSLETFKMINAQNQNSEEQVDIYFRTDKQLVEAYKEGRHPAYVPEEMFVQACENTIKIADSIEPFDLKVSQDLDTLKEYFDGDVNEILLNECLAGFKKRIMGKVADPQTYMERFKKEYSIVVKKNFATYFLVLKRVLNELKNKDVWRGIGRGSGGSFLINYLLGITNIDPIEYGLMSWRFLDETREDYPDIDIDIEDRKIVYETFQECFPNHEVLLISNKATLLVKALMKYIWKTLDIQFPVEGDSLKSSDAISKHLDENYDVLKITIDDFLNDEFVQAQFKQFRRIRPDVGLESLFRLLYRNLSGISVHAGGIVIVDPSENIVPLVPLVDNDIASYASAYGESGSVKELESIGKIKFDMLGLANLRMLHEAVISVSNGENIDYREIYSKIDPDQMDLNIPEVYESFRNGYTEGIFQFSSDGMTKLLNNFQVQSIYDLGICNALYRPGPLQNGFDELVIDAKRNELRQGNQYSTKLYSLIKDILEKTYSYPVFEEQIGLIGQRIGNFDDSQLNRFRKFLKDGKVTKQINPEKFEQLEREFHDQFINHGAEKGIEQEELEDLWNSLVQFSDYSFNASHALSYSLLAYQTQFFNTFYPGYWYQSVLNQTKEAIEKIPAIISQIRSRELDINFKISQVDDIHDKFTFKSNKSGGGTIYIGLNSVKGIGEKATEALRSDAFRVEMKSIQDIIDIAKENDFRAVNKTVLLTLANLGMLEIFGSREEVRADILIAKDKEYRVELEQDGEKKRKKYRAMTRDEAMEKDFNDNHVDNMFFYQEEQKCLGMSFSPNPVSYLIDRVNELSKDPRLKGTYVDAGLVSEVHLKQSKKGIEYYTITMNSVKNPENLKLFVWEKNFDQVGRDVLGRLERFSKIVVFAHKNDWTENTTYNVDLIMEVD